MARKRSRLEIYLDILEIVKSGVNKPTNIMYKCNLSWIPMQDILASLTERELIEIVEKGKKRTYKITERGRELLTYLENVLDMLVTTGGRKGSAVSVLTRPASSAHPSLRKDLPPLSRYAKPSRNKRS